MSHSPLRSRGPHRGPPRLLNWVFPAQGERINPGSTLPLLCSAFAGNQPTLVRWFNESGTLLASRSAAPWGAMTYAAAETSHIRCEVTIGGVARNYFKRVVCSRALPSEYSVLGSPDLAVIPDITAPIGSGYCSAAANLGSLVGEWKAYPVVAVDYPVVTSYPNIVDSNYNTRSQNLLPLRRATRGNGRTYGVFGSDGTNANRQLRTTTPLTQTRFLHNGSGCTIYASVCQVAATSFTILGSLIDGPPGIALGVEGDGRVSIRVQNAGGTQVVNYTTTARLVLGTTYLMALAYDTTGGAITIYDGATTLRETFTAGTPFADVNAGSFAYIARGLAGYQGPTLAFSARHTNLQVDSQVSALWGLIGSVSNYTPTVGQRIVVRGDCWAVGTWDVAYSGQGWATYPWQYHIPGLDCEVFSRGKYEPNGLTNPNEGIARLAPTEVQPYITAGAFAPLLLDGDDFVFQGATGSSLHAAVTEYLTTLKGWGATTFRTTMAPRAASYGAVYEAARLDYNNLTRASQPQADTYLDMDTLFTQTYGAYLGDGILYSNGGPSDDQGHPTDLGYRLWGHLIGQQYQTFLGG